MKILKYIIIGSLAMVFAVACNKGIDPISYVDPGPDTVAPVVTINYPIEGTKIRVDEPVTSINIKFVAADEIEIKSISIKLDGAEIATFSSFKDYRRYMGEFQYDNITDGAHALSVTATDLTDKSTTQTVNFKKIAAYVPLDGEVMYVPFDGDYFELVGKKELTVLGLPGFVDGKVEQAYAGAIDAGMTYPAPASLMASSEFSLSFWYKLNGLPKRGGIISISRPNTGTLTTTPPDSTRFKGFRFFHEDNGKNENLGIDIGIGKSEQWMNPFITLKPTVAGDFGDWIHIAISISSTKAIIYVNGVSKMTANLKTPINWTDCNLISIATGVPNFIYWGHLYDMSLYDELHIFKKAITPEEVTALYGVKK